MADSDKGQYSQSESPSKDPGPASEPSTPDPNKWSWDNIVKPHRDIGNKLESQRKAQPTPKGTFGWGGLTN
jgi:hypothetical protein